MGIVMRGWFYFSFLWYAMALNERLMLGLCITHELKKDELMQHNYLIHPSCCGTQTPWVNTRRPEVPSTRLSMFVNDIP